MILGQARKAAVWILCAGIWLVSHFAPGQDPPLCLWQIGEADLSTKDLMLGPAGYEKFSADPVFRVGTSKAGEVWPYVHPGPDDSWAGGREHVFAVLFTVAEMPRPLEGKLVVRLHLYDTHSSNPPRVQVVLNGEAKSQNTEPGAGDASITQGGPGRAAKLSFDFPAQRLVPGTNVVEIHNAEGSWFLYDAVQFLTPTGVHLGEPPPYCRIEQLQDTVLQRKQKGQPTQIVRMHVLASADRPVSASLRLTISGFGISETVTQTVSVRPGIQWLDVDIPRRNGWPATVTAALTVEKGISSTATAIVRSHRIWTVYLVPHSHVDIGYTDVQTKILELQKRCITETMDFVEKHPEYKDDARFCWNVEVLWAVKDFLREADATQRERFLRHVATGTIGLDALYANELTGLCSSEEMARLVAYSGRLLEERYAGRSLSDSGVKIDSAMITDVPGYSWGLAAAMGNAGIKYLDMGVNGSARIGSVRRVWRDRPFYWRTPNGRERVLTWLSPFDYHRVFDLLQSDKGIGNLLSYLRALESNPNYPYDVIRTRMCTGDNGTPPFHLSQLVQDWNAKWESPHLVIGRTRDAFVEIEKKFGDRIPTYSGDFSPYWEDGAASTADELARNRRAAKTLETAEKIWSAAAAHSPNGGIKPPADTLDRAWDNVLLFDEHTWGAHNSISEPDAAFVQAQWKIKQAFALDAERQADQVIGDGLAALARQVQTGKDRVVLVFNPCSWERTDLARVELPSAERVAVVDSAGRALASVRSNDGRGLTFVARDVPPLGYRTYRLVAEDQAKTASVQTPLVDAEKGRLESRFFSVCLNENGTSATSIETPKRWPRPKRVVSREGFDRYLYCSEGDPNRVASPPKVAIEMAKPDSPDGAALVMRSQAPGCRSLVQKIEIHSELPWIDVTNTLDRDDVRKAEGLYFDFPFHGLKQPQIRFDTAWAPVRLEDDLLPAACKNWFCVQDWVEISDTRQTVVLTPIDAPLIEVGEIHPNTRSHLLPEVERLRLEPPRILSFVMNNYWFTNYRASQPGTTSFRYRLYRYDGSSDPVRTMRRGIEAREPLRTAIAKADNAAGPFPANAHSFAQAKPDHVIITAIAGPPGNTLIRLYEITGKRAKVTLNVPGFGNVAARVDLRGQFLDDLAMREGRVRLEIGPREIATVRIQRKTTP